MSNRHRGGLSRRDFLQTSALGVLGTAGVLATPSVLRAQAAGVKLGILQPVTGALSYSGQQGKLGAQLAIDELNAAGGVKGGRLHAGGYRSSVNC